MHFNEEFAITGSLRHTEHDITHLINIPYIFWTCWERAILSIHYKHVVNMIITMNEYTCKYLSITLPTNKHQLMRVSDSCVHVRAFCLCMNDIIWGFPIALCTYVITQHMLACVEMSRFCEFNCNPGIKKHKNA